MVRIRQSETGDIPRLRDIENSAGDLFRTIADLAWVADGEDMSIERHLQLIEQGTSWVAESNDGILLAFLCAEGVDDVVHIWELAVALDHQRRGIGRSLMKHAIDFARQRLLAAVTLTTFLNVPWNEPAYLRMGFETLPPNRHDRRIAMILKREAEAGLPSERRCAMRLSLTAATST